jgi:hypothetical protein
VHRRLPSPALVVATAALFVALGGSAFAVSKARPLTACANGTVKGYAVFDLDNVSGSLTSSFSSDAHWFKTRFACTGATPQIRSNNGTIEIRFPGVAIRAATASIFNGANPAMVGVNFFGDTVRISTFDAGGPLSQHGFSVIVS